MFIPKTNQSLCKDPPMLLKRISSKISEFSPEYVFPLPREKRQLIFTSSLKILFILFYIDIKFGRLAHKSNALMTSPSSRGHVEQHCTLGALISTDVFVLCSTQRNLIIFLYIYLSPEYCKILYNLKEKLHFYPT